MRKAVYKHPGGGSLLQNEDEAEIRHLHRLLTHPPPWSGKEIRVVTWTGGWLCVCGRVCWPKQHCKACGQLSPCRDWCFEGGCNTPVCRFPHPAFLLPATKPPLNANGRSTAEDRELLCLPPPGSRPASVGVREKRGQKQQEKLQKRATMATIGRAGKQQPTAVAEEVGWTIGSPRPRSGAAHSTGTAGWGSEAAVWPADVWDAGVAAHREQVATGTGGSDIWQDLVARARAAMPSMHGSVQEQVEPAVSAARGGSMQGATSEPEAGAAGAARIPVVAPASAQSAGCLVVGAVDPCTVDWTGLLGVQTPMPKEEQHDSELERMLAQLCT